MTDTHNALALANELDTKAQALGCPLDRFSAVLRLQHTRIAELEAQLYAVGAGGVGQSIKPQVQADTAQAQQEPVAWLVCSTNPDGSLKVEHAATWKEAAHEHINDAIVEYEVSEAGSWIVQPAYTAPRPTENLRCKSTQKRLATLWGYVKKEPDHFRDAAQMVPARQPLTDSQVKELAKKHPAEDLCRWSYGMGIKDAEAAHGITGGQQ